MANVNLNTNKNEVSKLLIFSILLLIIGFFTIIINLIINFIFLLNHTIFDIIPSDTALALNEVLLFVLIPLIGGLSIYGFLKGIQLFIKNGSIPWLKRSLTFFVFATFAINISLMIGGGWYIGCIFSNIGIWMILYIALQQLKTKINVQPTIQKNVLPNSINTNTISKIDQIRNKTNIKRTLVTSMIMIMIVLLSSITQTLVSFNQVVLRLAETRTAILFFYFKRL